MSEFNALRPRRRNGAQEISLSESNAEDHLGRRRQQVVRTISERRRQEKEQNARSGIQNDRESVTSGCKRDTGSDQRWTDSDQNTVIHNRKLPNHRSTVVSILPP